MSPALDVAKVDLVLQYAVLLAGQEDDYRDRQLGPIHLIKYVYLADLAIAQGNGGRTFTGVEWTFYKFGPWSQVVNARIEPALTAIGAERFAFESSFEEKEEWVRWSKRDNPRLEALERSLPLEIKVSLRRFVHEHGKNTPALLELVYKTPPMLRAAPGERLEFSGEALRASEQDEGSPRLAILSEKQRKKLREKMRELRARPPTAAPAKLVKPPEPLYDGIYKEGLAWLDSLAGLPFVDQTLTVEFGDDVWKSSARNGIDVP